MTGTRRALVVDDDLFSREFAATLLRQAGFDEVDAAGDGAAALAMAAAAPPALIVCDLIMPRMDGLELLRRLAEAGCRSRIVLASGLDARLLSSAARVAGARGLDVLGCLEKPIAIDRLRALIAAADAADEAALADPPDARVPPAGPVIGPEDLIRGLGRQEFHAHFQPKYRVADGKLAGVEALARWRHATLGAVPPTVFVPAAERHGLVERLTTMVLLQSTSWLCSLGERGRGLSIAINLSMDDLHCLDFCDRAADLVAAGGVGPEHVICEVTESQLMREPTVALEVLARLRLRGFRLSIDDFGTGWSSLDQLRQVPFEELKLDARFVTAAPEDDAAMAIVESSARLARRLGMSVVAEGVETAAQLELCRRLGIDLAQGHLLGRAMPAHRLAARYLPG